MLSVASQMTFTKNGKDVLCCLLEIESKSSWGEAKTELTTLQSETYM